MEKKLPAEPNMVRITRLGITITPIGKVAIFLLLREWKPSTTSENIIVIRQSSMCFERIPARQFFAAIRHWTSNLIVYAKCWKVNFNMIPCLIHRGEMPIIAVSDAETALCSGELLKSLNKLSVVSILNSLIPTFPWRLYLLTKSKHGGSNTGSVFHFFVFFQIW